MLGRGFEKQYKKARKERFLEEMGQVIPWKDLSNALGSNGCGWGICIWRKKD